MSRNGNARDGENKRPEGTDADDFDPHEYEAMIQLERLESLEEDMIELGVTTLDDVRRRIAELNRELDHD
jgi:hypothetical protein